MVLSGILSASARSLMTDLGLMHPLQYQTNAFQPGYYLGYYLSYYLRLVSSIFSSLRQKHTSSASILPGTGH